MSGPRGARGSGCRCAGRFEVHLTQAHRDQGSPAVGEEYARTANFPWTSRLQALSVLENDPVRLYRTSAEEYETREQENGEAEPIAGRAHCCFEVHIVLLKEEGWTGGCSH